MDMVLIRTILMNRQRQIIRSCPLSDLKSHSPCSFPTKKPRDPLQEDYADSYVWRSLEEFLC